MNKKMIDTIAKLISDNGIEILNQRKTVSILKDLIPGERDAIRLFSIFAESDVGMLIIKGVNEKQNWHDIQKFAAQKLNKEAFLDIAKANELLSEIGEAIAIGTGYAINEKGKTISTPLNEISIKSGKPVKSITVSGNTYHKYDIISFDDNMQDSKIIYSICLADDEIYVFAEIGSMEKKDDKEVFIHSCKYGIYRIDNENYFNKVTDKNTILGLRQYLLDGMRKGIYGVLVTKFISEWVTNKDIDLAKDALNSII